jgi:hypothetical protein
MVECSATFPFRHSIVNAYSIRMIILRRNIMKFKSNIKAGLNFTKIEYK